MDQFVVSARKYRPATFKSVVGQQAITGTLQNAIKNSHLAQAFLFCGPRGVGKTTCARILAKTINCFQVTPEFEACNECESCVAFNESSSFNIHELDAASNNSVDDIRSLVDQVRFAPQIGRYSIYIIDEVHMLSSAAFNAFLKTLEEPPAHAIFILATTERHKILPTILSRCQVFVFNRITVDDMAKHLEYVSSAEKISADPDALHVIAQKADGALRDALSMFDQIVSYSGGDEITYSNVIENLNILDYDYYFKVTEHLVNNQYTDVLLTFDVILRKGFDGSNFLAGLSDHFRNLLVCKDVATIALLETSPNIKSRFQSQAQICKTPLLIKALEILNKADIGFKASRNQRLTVELALLQVYQLFLPESQASLSNESKPISAASPTSNTSAAQTNESAPKPMASASVAPPQPVTKNVDALNFNLVGIKSKPKPSAATSGNKVDDGPVNFIISDVPDKPFSQNELEIVWKAYADKVNKAGHKMLCTTLTHTLPKLGTDNLVSYELQNSAQLSEIQNEKIELMGYLRKELQNKSIKIEFTVAEVPVQNRPFTNDEKLKFFEEENKDFALFKDKFDLKVE
jgi:DNA polymerase-3 subunit gamma/tau